MKRRKPPDRAEGGKSSARFLILAWLLLAACSPTASRPQLEYKDGAVVASGWSGPPPVGGWESVLIIRASDDRSAPALLGEYKESGGVITFTPRFPPSPGVELHASFKPVARPEIAATFGESSGAIVATTTVAHLYPSSDEWPANTLKMYLEFSAPMASGDAYSLIRALDDQGRAIEKPFVEVEPELWDPSGTRLTILFDPGRLKRGLVDNETAGPPLTSGRTVTIEVDPSGRDASGAPLAEKFSRTIRVADAVRSPVDVKRWRVESPASKGDDLIIAFDRPLDHAIAPRAISVKLGGSPVTGKIALEENETRLRFTPHSPWAPGRYAIRVDGVIEDLAGNRLGKLFDVDTSDPSQARSATPFAEIAFEIPVR
jgi:hypothetical protein